MVGTDQADTLRVMQEEMAELSLRVEKLERAALWEGSGGSSGSGGNEWVWWNGTWWIRTKSRMNSASKRKVSRVVKQAMRQDDEKLKADLNRMMAYLKHEMSDTDHETTRRRNSVEQANNVKANEDRMCVCLQDWTFQTCTLFQIRVMCGQFMVFPAGCVQMISPKL